ncbi:hypothetical protein N7450_011743 [Penicillium hetheringtonii]|uniref:Uncharacterized protein n=1 Tax=Penicillium hetheringtonii TaxID=911720 RepID=A0AAD6GN98_9EURO|nr:hypothetical protein N7450_011743 [Penicillium hetheringtonii]
MSDQSNPAPSYWLDQARAHIAQFNKLHDEKRGEEKSNLQSEHHSSERQPKSCFRDRMEGYKSRPEVKRRRKVRFEGIPENESVDSSSSGIDDQPRTNW